MSQQVTRLEIVETVGAVFDHDGAMREEIMAAAGRAARPEVIAVLQSLPERRYNRLNELWEELHDIPVGV